METKEKACVSYIKQNDLSFRHDKLFMRVSSLSVLYCICTIFFMSKFPQVAIAVSNYLLYCVREIGDAFTH